MFTRLAILTVYITMICVFFSELYSVVSFLYAAQLKNNFLLKCSDSKIYLALLVIKLFTAKLSSSAVPSLPPTHMTAGMAPSEVQMVSALFGNFYSFFTFETLFFSLTLSLAS